jgi:hypothetical protein
MLVFTCWSSVFTSNLFIIWTQLKTGLMAIALLLLSVTAANAQIKNTKTENRKIFKLRYVWNEYRRQGASTVAMVDWIKTVKWLQLPTTQKKTNSDEILKRIALAGYDSEKFSAPDDVYDNLHGCCQYDREVSLEVTTQKCLKRKWAMMIILIILKLQHQTNKKWIN